MFRASLCPSSGEQDVCYCMCCAALRCFCWMWLVAEAAQHNTCSNIRIVLLKMGIMMPETCWEIVKNKHLTVASCWFSLSLHNLLTMHGHRNLKSSHILLWYTWSAGAFAFTQTVCLLKLVIRTTNALACWRLNVETKTKRTLHSSRRLSFNELVNAKSYAA